MEQAAVVNISQYNAATSGGTMMVGYSMVDDAANATYTLVREEDQSFSVLSVANGEISTIQTFEEPTITVYPFVSWLFDIARL